VSDNNVFVYPRLAGPPCACLLNQRAAGANASPATPIGGNACSVRHYERITYALAGRECAQEKLNCRLPDADRHTYAHYEPQWSDHFISNRIL
jgi:hypothetical protein